MVLRSPHEPGRGRPGPAPGRRSVHARHRRAAIGPARAGRGRRCGNRRERGGSGYHGPLGSSTRGHTRRAAPVRVPSETSKVNEGLCPTAGATGKSRPCRLFAGCAALYVDKSSRPAGSRRGAEDVIIGKLGISRPVSRVLYGPEDPRGSPERGGHSSGTAVADRLEQPTRATGLESGPALPRGEERVAPIRFCSRWGLPCRPRCRVRGALLPHPFTLAGPDPRGSARWSALCGTVPGVAPAGRYPAPSLHGARTFLPGPAHGRTR